MKGNAIGPDERKEAPAFTRGHLEYLEKTFKVPPVEELEGKEPNILGRYVGQQQVINHIRSLVERDKE